jgi:hypothetical protein
MIMRNLKTSKSLLKEAKEIQKQCLNLDTYWSLVNCLDVIITHEYVKTNSEAIVGAIEQAKEIDKVFSESIA